MMTKRSTKSALISSILVLSLCLSALLGTTFAWFTDSVTSANNIIKSGSLDVTMEWADGTKAVPADDSADWTDASTGAIFSYNLWEPGYVTVRHIKIANEGTLALKYQISIVANGEITEVTDADGSVHKLSDVIDVYYVDPAQQVTDRTALENAPKLGTLTEVLGNLNTSAYGELLAGEKHTVTLALKMQESAGNIYQDLAIGDSFSIQLLATQLTYEKDSFDDQYDADAYSTVVRTESQLLAAIADGNSVILGADIDLSQAIAIQGNDNIAIDLAGHALTQTIECVGSYEMISNNGNLTINDSVGGGKISFTDTGAGDPNFDWGSYTIRNQGNLTVNGGTIEYLGTQAFATHCSLAIFQYSGSTTINGGTISNPAYRSLRLWKGDVTINGGEFDGQVWVHCVDNSSDLTINGGSFGPNGRDGSSVFVNNDGYESKLAITGGNFSTKVGCDDAAALAGAISGGNFSDSAKNNTNAALVAAGYAFADNGDGTWTVKGEDVSTADELIAAIHAGKVANLTADITLPEKVTVSGNAVIDLNGHKISTTANYDGNQELFLVKGNMTVKNGSMEFVAENNQGWEAMATIFDVTAGGSLTLENVTASISGTDMNFIVHLNNWGSATLTVKDCDFTTTYVAVRAFNSGYDMNTVTIENTDFHGGRMFWVHNYTAEGKDDSTLTLDIYGNGNTTDNAKPVRFGFSNSIYFDIDGNQIQ